MRRIILTTVLGAALVFWTVVVFPLHTTKAQQTPPAPLELLMSWSANTYTPATYPGKALPTPGSTVTVSVQGVRNGALTNLGAQTINWYVNDQLFTSGTGLQSIALPIGTAGTRSFTVRIELPDATVEPSVKTITIPIVRPSGVIVAPLPNDVLSGGAITLFGIPYFFNVTTARNVLFSWTVNDQATTATENPDQLHLSVGNNAAGNLAIGLTATNAASGSTESSRSVLNLTATP